MDLYIDKTLEKGEQPFDFMLLKPKKGTAVHIAVTREFNSYRATIQSKWSHPFPQIIEGFLVKVNTPVEVFCMNTFMQLEAEGHDNYRVGTINKGFDCESIVTIPLHIDTEMNRGTFLYTHLGQDKEFNTKLFQPITLNQSLEAWLENFTVEERERALQGACELLNFKLEPRTKTVERAFDFVDDEIIKGLLEHRTEALVFNDEDRLDETDAILRNNAEICEFTTVGDGGHKSIIGTNTKNRAGGYITANEQPFMIDLKACNLEASLQRSSEFFLLQNAGDYLERLVNSYNLTPYEAWRTLAIYIPRNRQQLDFYMTVEEFIRLNLYSKGQFIDLIADEHRSVTVIFSQQDFKQSGGRVLRLLLSHGRLHTSVGSLGERILFPNKDKDELTDMRKAMPRYAIYLVDSPLKKSEIKIGTIGYAAQLDIYRMSNALNIDVGLVVVDLTTGRPLNESDFEIESDIELKSETFEADMEQLNNSLHDIGLLMDEYKERYPVEN